MNPTRIQHGIPYAHTHLIVSRNLYDIILEYTYLNLFILQILKLNATAIRFSRQNLIFRYFFTREVLRHFSVCLNSNHVLKLNIAKDKVNIFQFYLLILNINVYFELIIVKEIQQQLSIFYIQQKYSEICGNTLLRDEILFFSHLATLNVKHIFYFMKQLRRKKNFKNSYPKSVSNEVQCFESVAKKVEFVRCTNRVKSQLSDRRESSRPA